MKLASKKVGRTFMFSFTSFHSLASEALALRKSQLVLLLLLSAQLFSALALAFL